MSHPELKGEKDGNKITEMSVRDFALKYKLDQSRLEQVFDLKNLTGKKITDDKFRSILAEAKVGSEVYVPFSIYNLPPYMKTTDFAFSNRAKVDALLNFIVNASDEKAEGSASKALEVRKSISVVLGDYLLVLEKENRKPLLKESKTVDAEVLGQPAERDKLKANAEAQPEGGSWFARSWGKTKKFFSSTDETEDAAKKKERLAEAMAPVVAPAQVQTTEAPSSGFMAAVKTWLLDLFSTSEKPAEKQKEATGEMRRLAKSAALAKEEKEAQGKAETQTTWGAWKAFWKNLFAPSKSSSETAQIQKEKKLFVEGLQATYGFSAQNSSDLLRLAGAQKTGISKTELTALLADSGLSYAYASISRFTKTWDAEALIGLLEKKNKSKDEAHDSEIVLRKLGEGLGMLKSINPGENPSKAVFESVKNRMLQDFPKLSKNAEINSDFIAEISGNLSQHEEEMRRYCEAFGISSKEELLARWESLGYAKFWRKEFIGKVGAFFTTNTKLIRGILNEIEQEEMTRYSLQIKATMAFELIFKEKYGDKADGHIKELLKNREIGRMEDVPHLDENGKTVLRKLSILQIIGLALEGPVLKGGEELHFSFGKDTQEKYRKESMEVLKAALFGKDGELQSDDQELRNNLATAISVIGAGYFHVIKQEEEYKNESGELLKFYNHASESRKRAQEDNQALLKKGVITENDAEKYSPDMRYVSNYSMIYQMYASALTVNQGDVGKALGLTEEKMLGYASASASSLMLAELQNQYLNHSTMKKNLKEYRFATAVYARQLNDISASLGYQQNVEFFLSLINNSKPGKEAYAQWDKKNPNKGYGKFVSERIEQKWLEVVPEQHLISINGYIGRTKGIDESGKPVDREPIEDTPVNRKLYMDLAFNKGFTPDNIALAIVHYGKSMKEIAEAHSTLEKDQALQGAIREKASALGLVGKEFGKYSDVLVKALLPRLTLISLSAQGEAQGEKLMEEARKAISGISVAEMVKAGRVLGASKDEVGEYLLGSKDKSGKIALNAKSAKDAEINHSLFLFLKKCGELLPVKYNELEKYNALEKGESKSPAQAPVEVKVKEKPISDLEFKIRTLKNFIGPEVDLYFKGAGLGTYQGIEVVGGRHGKNDLKVVSQVQDLFNLFRNSDGITRMTNSDLAMARDIIANSKLPIRMFKRAKKANGREELVPLSSKDAKKELLRQVDALILKAKESEDGAVAFKTPSDYYDGMTVPAVVLMQVWAREVVRNFKNGEMRKLKNGDKLSISSISPGDVERIYKSGVITKDIRDGLMSEDIDVFEKASNELEAKGKKFYDQVFRSYDVTYVRTEKKDDLLDAIVGPVTLAALTSMVEHLGELLDIVEPVIPEPVISDKIEPEPAAPVQISKTHAMPAEITISMMPEASSVTQNFPYHSLLVPQAPEVTIITAPLKSLNVGNINVDAAIISKAFVNFLPLMNVTVANPFTFTTPIPRAQAEAILNPNGTLRPSDVRSIIDNIFTTDAAGNPTGLKPLTAGYTETEVKEKYEKAKEDYLKAMKPIVLGLRYGGQIKGVDYSITPSMMIPTGEGKNMLSLAASLQKNYAIGNMSIGGSFGVLGGSESPLLLTGTLGYDFGGISPFLMGGFANGKGMIGAGTFFQVGGNTIGVSGTYAPGVGVVTLQIDRPGMGVIGISVLIIGGVIIPLPFLIGDITNGVNWGLEAVGAIDHTVDSSIAIPGPVSKLRLGAKPKKVQ